MDKPHLTEIENKHQSTGLHIFLLGRALSPRNIYPPCFQGIVERYFIFILSFISFWKSSRCFFSFGSNSGNEGILYKVDYISAKARFISLHAFSGQWMFIGLPLDWGWGGGLATHGKFDIFSFQMSISPPLGSKFRSAILHKEMNTSKCGKLIQMTTGYVLRPLTTHSLVLHFPRWQLSQISHPGDVQDVTFPTHVHFTESNSRRLPPVLGQTIAKCIKQ